MDWRRFLVDRRLAPRAVAAGRDITGTVITGPVTVQVGERVARPAAGGSAQATVDEYLARLRARYGYLDVETLLPLDSQDERIPIGVPEVFVPQTVRANPPPIELPRELWQRLARTGAIDPGELPGHLDRDVLAQVRRSYEARPARPVLEVLAEPAGQRMVVLGDPGAGKSTLARYLAVVLAQRADGLLPAGLAGLLPVLIELRTYADPRWRDNCFLDFLDHQHRTDDRLGLPRDLLERFLRDPGQVLVVFDGLDELFDPGARESVTHQITGFATKYPRARILVTSRHIGYQRGGFDTAGFSHHMLQDLDHAQIAAFAERWYRIACPGNPADGLRLRARLLAAIGGSRAVRELAGNPLLLTILAIIGRRRELPRDRLTVYEHAVTVLVEQWEVNKHLAGTVPDLPPLDRRDKLDLLRLVARRMQDAPAGLAGNHIAGPDLLTMFQTYLQDSHGLAPGLARCAARAMLEQFRHRNFILSRFGGEVYGFVHRAFLEYLAAADIDERFGNRELSEDDLIHGVFGGHWRDPAWHEVLLLLTGMREHFADRIIDFLLAADPLWDLRPRALPHHALLAVRCLGETRKPGALPGQNTAVARVLTTLLETATKRAFDSVLVAAIRQAALPVVAGLGPRWTGRDHYLAWYRIRGQTVPLGQICTNEAIPLATRIAVALDPSEAFRGRLGDTAARGRHEDVRRAAVEAIAAGWPEHPDTLPLLRERCTADPHEAVRQAAAEAIAAGWPTDPHTILLLRERATADPHEAVRRVAVRALAAGRAAGPDTLIWLRERAITDQHQAVRQAAVEAIAAGWADGPGALPWLCGRVTADQHEDVRRVALEAIAGGWPSDPRTLLLLRGRAIADQDRTVRRAAVQAVAAGWATDPNTLPWLRECAITDPHEYVRQAAVEAIAAGWPTRPSTLPWLFGYAATDPHEHVRQAAVRSIAAGWPTSPETLPWLRERATADPHRDVRRAAVQAVATGWSTHPGTLPLLRGWAVADHDGAVRQAAVQAIAAGWLTLPATLPWLRERATGDPHRAVRQAAMEAVAAGWPTDPGVLRWLRARATTDSNEYVRQAAVQTIVATWAADTAILPWLRERATTDPHRAVRQTAVEAIAAGWPAHPDTLPLLRERATTDPHEAVRQVSVEGIAAGWPADPRTPLLLRERATGDPHPVVRRAAVELLAAGWPARYAGR